VDEWQTTEIREKKFKKLCFYVYSYAQRYLWINPYIPRMALCREKLNPVSGVP
jgi:hypothetical protein